ncbi:MAG: DUF2269 domain-containing protein [Polyangiaceae bacterium]|nr:DUF2269 domain-containing protein [Polyangiaceae bacterium]
MLIAVVKLVHVLAAVLFLGTGLGSAYYKLRAARSGQLAVIAWCDAEVVRADWVFTVPAGLLVPATGLWLVELYGMTLAVPWVWQGLLGYTVAGLTWLPAAALQLRMRAASAVALRDGAPLGPAWHRAQRIWMLLGVPSFAATLAVVWMMVSKRALW